MTLSDHRDTKRFAFEKKASQEINTQFVTPVQSRNNRVIRQQQINFNVNQQVRSNSNVVRLRKKNNTAKLKLLARQENGPDIYIQTLMSQEEKKDDLNPEPPSIMTYRGSEQSTEGLPTSKRSGINEPKRLTVSPDRFAMQNKDPLMQSFGVNAGHQQVEPTQIDNSCIEFITDDHRDETKRQRPKQLTSVVDGLMKQSLNLISESRNRFLSRSFKKTIVDESND